MALLDLVFPLRCVGCGCADVLVCDSCLAPLAGRPRPAVPRPCPAGLPPTWTIAAYDGSVRSLLIAYKERGVRDLKLPLGAALSLAIAAACGQGGEALVVPVPSSAAAVRHRGDDVVGALAAQAVRRLRRSGWPVRTLPALRQRRGVADSAGLGAAARAENLDHALELRGSAARLVEGRVVVLSDDLVTTGSSLSEAARALRAAGARVVGAATIAATVRHFGG